jgi:autotransporter-associated beta strand protein
LLPFYLAALLPLFGSAARAASGTWTNTASGGLWSAATNWGNGAIADGAGATADFSTLNLGSNYSVQFDAPRTLSAIKFGDTASTYYNWTLNNNGDAANVLTLDGAANPAITVTTGRVTNNVVIAGSAGLTTAGSATAASYLYLNAANTFTGDVTAASGAGSVDFALVLGSALALGDSNATNNVTLIGNATSRSKLYLFTSGASYPSTKTLVMRPAGTTSASRTELHSAVGSGTWNGPIVLDGSSGSSLVRNDIYADTSTLTINGNITTTNAFMGLLVVRGAGLCAINGIINTPTATMVKDDSGIWALASTGNSWASLQVLNGAIRLRTNNALPLTAIAFGSTTPTYPAILQMNGFSQLLTSNVTAVGTAGKCFTNATSSPLSILTFSNSADISCAVSIGGYMSLVKLDKGTLTLSDTNTYTGSTVISNGVLRVASSGLIIATTNIMIGPGAVFSAAGLSLGAAQTLSPMDQSSVVSGAVSLGAGSLALNYAEGSPSLTVTNGTLTLSGNSTVTVNSAFSVSAGRAYLLVSGVAGGVVSGEAPTNVVLRGAYGQTGALIISNSALYLTVDSRPSIAAQYPRTDTCPYTLFAGASPSFTVVAGGLPPLSYVWYTNGVLNSSVTSSNLTWTNLQPGAITAYCVVTNDYGAATSAVWSASVVAAPAESYPVAVMSNSPVGYWRLNETSGVIAQDYCGGKNGIYTNVLFGLAGYSSATDPAMTSVGFGFGYANNSDASAIYGIDFGSPTNTGRTFTVETWAACGGTLLTDAGLVTVGYGGGEQLDLDAGGASHAYRFLVRDAAGVAYTASSSTVPDTSGAWHHFAGVCDQPNGKVTLYIDGRVAARVTIPTNAGILGGTSPMSIGARYTSASAKASGTYDGQFVGLMNDVAVYSSALSSNQVLDHYLAAGIAPFMTRQPVGITNVNQNATLIVAAEASGTAPLTYSWFDVNANSYISGQTNATLVVSNLQASDSYYLTVANAYGSVNSSTVSASVMTGLSASLTPNTNLAIYTGRTVRYSANAYGTAPLYYRWYLNGVAVSEATNGDYSLAVPAGSTTVSCVVSNSYDGYTSLTLGPVTLVGVAAPTNLYPLAVLSNNPAAYWPLNEADNGLNDGNAGVVARDYVGGHNAAYTNVNLGLAGFNSSQYPELTAGLFGSLLPSNSVAGELDQSASGIPTIDFGQPSGAGATFSVEAWVNGYPPTSDSGIITKGYGGGGEQFNLDTGGSSHAFRFFVRDVSGGTHAASGSIVPSFGAWHHLVGVCDEPNGKVALYVDGKLSASGTISSTAGILASTSLMSIGARYSTAAAMSANTYDRQFVGEINNVAIYGTVLSSNDVAAHYTIGTNVLSVIPTPGTLMITNLAGGQVQLIWNFSGALQSAGSAAGPYTNEPGAVSPFTVSATNGMMFYRVKQQ